MMVLRYSETHCKHKDWMVHLPFHIIQGLSLNPHDLS